MAGGIGSRFWPLSTKEKPKQFLDILGTGRTLIRDTFERFKNYGIPVKNFLVVTNIEYTDLVRDSIPELDDKQILGEPIMRNTAPAVAYAVTRIHEEGAKVMVTPADHRITNLDKFYSVLDSYMKSTKLDSIHIIGIKPTYPCTEYGYIQVESELKCESILTRVEKFKEKPDHQTAQEYLDSKKFHWNSGLFMGTVEAFHDAFSRDLPEVWRIFSEELSEDTIYTRRVAYEKCPSISFDYGILEKNPYVMTIANCDFGWSDLGSWRTVHKILAGENLDLAISPNKKKVVVLTKKPVIVVDTEDVLLVMDADTPETEFKDEIKKFI
jgi:mannose-1-phosphate guanylyltransferase